MQDGFPIDYRIDIAVDIAISIVFCIDTGIRIYIDTRVISYRDIDTNFWVVAAHCSLAQAGNWPAGTQSILPRP